MSWALYISISVLTASIGTLLGRYIQTGSRHSPIGFYMLAALSSSTVIAMFLAVTGGLDTRFDLIPLPNLLLSSVLWSVANVLMINSLKRVEASTFSVLFATRVAWTILLSLLFLGESLSLREVYGIGIMAAGTIVVAYDRGSIWDSKTTVLSLATAIVFGAALVNDGIVLEAGYDVPSYFLWAFLTPPIINLVASKSARRALAGVARDARVNRLTPLMGLLFAVSSVATFKAFQIGQSLSLLAGINQVQTALMVVGGVVFLRERNNLTKKGVGAALSIIGALVLVA